VQKKDRLKPLSLYGLDLKQALHAMLSVDPRKLGLEEKTNEGSDTPKHNRQSSDTKR